MILQQDGKVVILNGARTREATAPERARRFSPVMERFVDTYEWDPNHAQEMVDAFASKDPTFSFTALEREIARVTESATGGSRARGFERVTREAITTSQTAAAIGLVVIHTIFDDYGQFPAIYRDLAEIETSNGIDEIYPEEWADDMPVPVAETEPAPESRLSAGVIRIRNYEYARMLVISKRYFDRDKSGQVRRAAANFGRKYVQAMDKSFVIAFFRAGTAANRIVNGGTLPDTNLAGYNAYGTQYAPTAGPISPDRLEAALTAPAQFVDPYGTQLTVDMNTVFVDTFDRMRVKRYLTSQFTPNQPATDLGGTGAGPFSENPLRDEFQIAYSPFVKLARPSNSGTGFPWATLEAGRGAVMQIVQDLQVTQENPNAGRSFDERSYRWQGLAEWGTGVRNARVIYYGN